jgi:hypothetical protein
MLGILHDNIESMRVNKNLLQGRQAGKVRTVHHQVIPRSAVSCLARPKPNHAQVQQWFSGGPRVGPRRTKVEKGNKIKLV